MALPSWFSWGGSNGSANTNGVPDSQHPPGASRGLLHRLRALVGGWPGPRLAYRHRAGQEVESEPVRGGPRKVILPRFAPYYDDTSGETPQMRAAYRRMLADPNVSAAVWGTIYGVASLELQIHPATKTSPLDKEVADFVFWSLSRRIKEGFAGLIESILVPGLVDGYSVALKVWGPQDRGKYAGKYVLRKLKSMDTGNTIIPQTDDKLDVVGLMGLRYNAGEYYSPADFVLWRYRPLYNSPTGTSALRCVYSRWWMLDTASKLRMVAAERQATPVAMGKYANAAQQKSLEAALAQLKSQNWLAIPTGVEVELLNMAGAADSIFKALGDDIREEIFLGIKHATLQSLTGGAGEQRGSSRVHKSEADLVAWRLSSAIESLLNDEEDGLIKDIVDLNYVVAEYPRATLSAVDPSDLAPEIAIDEGLTRIGLSLSKEETYERYGRVPPKDGEEGEDALKGSGGQQPGGGPGRPPGPGTPDDDGSDLAALLGGNPDDGGGEATADRDEPQDFEEVSAFTRQARQFDEDATGHQHKGKGKGGGQFTSKGGGGATATKEPPKKEKKTKESAPETNNKGASSNAGKGAPNGHNGPSATVERFDGNQPIDERLGTLASKEEHAALLARVRSKIAAAPQPTTEEVAANKAGIEAKGVNRFRRDLVGNVKDRAKRRNALLSEFGDGKVCPCIYCAVHIGDNVKGSLEQDKIITTANGGRYRMGNLVPSCSDCNKRRSDMPIEQALEKVASYGRGK